MTTQTMEGLADRGRKLRERRENYGLTLYEVGDHVGWSVSHISNMETGKRPLSRDDERKLHRAISAIVKARREARKAEASR